MTDLRLLQVLGDTDRDSVNLAALELHSCLVDAGVEVRTLALAPGRAGGLEDVVPAIAPGRRSIAARTGLANERRWADVVLLHGERALTYATLPRRGAAPPTVVSLVAINGAVPPGAERGLSGRVLDRAALVVLVDGDATGELPSTHAASGSSVVVVGPDVDPAVVWPELLNTAVSATAGGHR